MPIFNDPPQYEFVKNIGSGNFGMARLCKDKTTGEKVAIKYIERGEKIDENVYREIINHRMLKHPNIVQFRKVLVTDSHLGIVMEYASGGELFDRICDAGRFSEKEARYYFQQLVCGVEYCHRQQICHRDLKLENTLLDQHDCLKICDFGYSKSSLLHSQPKSTVGTPAYIAPEVLVHSGYDGKMSDVWSCGVTLYVMLVGGYPFEDPSDPRNFRKTIQRIMAVNYSFPSEVDVSPECRDLVAQIFVADTSKRITLADVKRHPWFLVDLPASLSAHDNDGPSVDEFCRQSVEEITAIVQEAKTALFQAEPTEDFDDNMDDMNDFMSSGEHN